MHKSDFVAVGTWVALTVCLWIVAWIIAEAIPVFNSLLTLIVCSVFSHSSPLASMLTCVRLLCLVVGLLSGSLAFSGST